MNIFSLRALRTAACSLLLFAISFNALAAGYVTSGGRIYDAAGVEVQVRGVSHFGFNDRILQPMFLWSMGWKEQIAQIKSLGFNAVRLPFVPATLYSATTVDKLSYVDPGKNADLIGKTPLQALDMWMAEANRQGLYVLLDFHGVSTVRQYPTWFVTNPADFNLTYNQQAYTAADWKRDLVFVAKRYASLPYFFAIDVYNEPNGAVRWTAGDPNMTDSNYYWKSAVESAATAILAANPNLLIFVQGVNANYDGVEKANIPINWGENFQPQAYQPLNVPAGKLVLSPHTYGPDVYVKSSFSASNFPANLAADWDTLFGQFSQVYPVVPGEWGGRYGVGGVGAQDVAWQNAFVDYMLSKGIRNSFYWCYTPNSGDSGGILDDNLNVRQDKMTLLRKLWGGTTTAPAPAPTPTPTPTPTPVPTPSAVLDIDSFSPTSGPIGTVVTIKGKGMTGVNKAWAGNARNASVNVLSDTQVQVTIPSDATTGAIGIFTASQVSFTAQGFTVTSSAPTPTPAPTPSPSPTLVQPMIDNFSPASGPVGTVVTVNGSGFTGLNLAWIGAAHNGSVRVVSDRQAQVTIPAGATSGSIGIFNPQFVAFTATQFTVVAAAVSYPQPYIQNFSPASGPVGTVVTINGSGFTGLNLAWVGAARNGAVRVISDSQVQVTIPADATTGSIGIFNPKHVSFSATSFTVK